jgi:hypothetical protein
MTPPHDETARKVVRKWNETCIYMTPTDANLLTELIAAALREAHAQGFDEAAKLIEEVPVFTNEQKRLIYAAADLCAFQAAVVRGGRP